MPTPLTKRSLETLAREAQDTGADRRVPDGKVPGLYAAIRPSGRITFQLRYQAESGRHGRIRVIRLGAYGSGFTLEQARAKAAAVRGELATGADPAAHRDQLRTAARAQKARTRGRSAGTAPPTDVSMSRAKLLRMHGAVQAYFVSNVRLKARTRAEWWRMWERDIAPVLGNRPVADITPLELQAWHSTFRDRPVLGNRCLTFLSAFFTWAESLAQLRPLGSHPVLPLRSYRFREARKDRRLVRHEYRRLAKALHRSEQQDTAKVTVALVRFLALSGWRESEARTLKWSYVDFGRGVANLPDTKGGEDTRVLGKPALALLEHFPREQGNPYVFPGRRERQPLQEPKRAWTTLRTDARLADVVLHTFRHSFITTGAELGFGDAVIGKLVGHQPRGSTTASRYTHLDADSPILRTVADAIAAAIAGMMALHHPRRGTQAAERAVDTQDRSATQRSKSATA